MSDSTAMMRTPIEPSNMAELVTFATMAAKSRLFGVESPEQALMIAMNGRDLGLSYTQSLRAFHVIKGKASLSADGMVAVCLSHPALCESFRAVEVTDTSSTWETKRKGADVVRYTFTMDDASRAGLINDMYKKHPKRMLSARCKAYLARDVYPELLMGLVDDDEAREIGQRGHAPAQSGPPVEYTAAPVAAPSADPVYDASPAGGTDADVDALKGMLLACSSKSELGEVRKSIDVVVPKGHPRRAEVAAVYTAELARVEVSK